MVMHCIFSSQFLIFLVIFCANCEDFYHLLGISREADNRAIRRAFKKLALVKHPDKNPVSFYVDEKLCGGATKSPSCAFSSVENMILVPSSLPKLYEIQISD